MPPKSTEHVLSRGKLEALGGGRLPGRLLLPHRDTTSVSRGDVLPARGPLGPDAVPSWGIQRDGGSGDLHILPKGVYLSRVRADRPNDVPGRDGVQPGLFDFAQPTVSSW